MSSSARPLVRAGLLVIGIAVAGGVGKEPGAAPRAGRAGSSMAPPVAALAGAPADAPPGGRGKDIRRLNQHFNEPGADTAPWMFVPRENIKELFRRGRIPSAQRGLWPVLESDREIVWVRGFPPATDAVAAPSAREAVTITEEPYRPA